MQLLLNGTVYTAEKAKQMGFIDEIIDGNLEEWEHFVETMLTRELGVLEAYKQLVINKYEVANLRGRMETEIRECSKLWETEAHHQAVANFLNKK